MHGRQYRWRTRFDGSSSSRTTRLPVWAWPCLLSSLLPLVKAEGQGRASDQFVNRDRPRASPFSSSQQPWTMFIAGSLARSLALTPIQQPGLVLEPLPPSPKRSLIDSQQFRCFDLVQFRRVVAARYARELDRTPPPEGLLTGASLTPSRARRYRADRVLPTPYDAGLAREGAPVLADGFDPKVRIFVNRRRGEVAEWSIAPHSKCGVRASVPGVRIPPSPPDMTPNRLI